MSYSDSSPPETAFRFTAFISYRHSDLDRHWAKWLHASLETFRVPGNLVGKSLPRRLGKCFRDDDELSAATDLGAAIEEALRDSAYLIVVCSPRTPDSRWVSAEIEYFQRLGKGDRILTLLIEGEPEVSIPSALFAEAPQALGSEEESRRVHPLAADVRPVPTEGLRSRRRRALLRIVSRILGCSFDDLRQRDAERDRRRLYLIVGVVLAVLAVLAFGIYERERAITMTNLRDIAEGQRALTRRYQYAAQMKLAEKALAERNLPLAEKLLNAQVPADGADDLRRFEWHLLERKAHPELLSLVGHRDDVHTAVYNHDGSQLASCGGDADKTVRIWDANTGHERHCLRGHTGAVLSVAYDHVGRRLASGSADRTVRIWSSTGGSSLQTLNGHADFVRHVAFSGDGRYFASSDDAGVVQLRDAVNFRAIRNWNCSAGTPLAFSPDSSLLAVLGASKQITLFETETGELVQMLDLSGDRFDKSLDLAFSPDGLLLASAEGNSGQVRVWSVPFGELLWDTFGHQNAARTVAFSPDGSWLVSGGHDRELAKWDAISGNPLGRIQGHTHFVTSIHFSPDGSRSVSGGADSLVKIWDMTGAAAQTERVWDEQGGFSWQIAFSPDGTRLATADGQSVNVWDALTTTRRLTLRGHTDEVLGVRFSPDGSRIVSCSKDGTAKLWNARTGAHIRTLVGHRKSINGVDFSPDGQQIVTASSDQSLKLWNSHTGEVLQTLLGHGQEVQAAAFNHDGAMIASVGWDRDVRLWDSKTGENRKSLSGHRTEIVGVKFSPNGKLLASAGLDNSVKVWDVVTGKEKHELLGHAAEVPMIAFSPDGQRLASTSFDGTIRVWDVELGLELLSLSSGESDAVGVAFSPDGRRLALTHRNGTLRLISSERSPTDIAAAWESWPWNSARESESNRQWFSAHFYLTRLIHEFPDDETLYWRRADVNAEMGQWDQALSDFAAALKAKDDDPVTWHDFGMAQLATGDRAAYQQTCQTMHQQFARSRDPNALDGLIGLSVLAPDVPSEVEKLVPLVERATEDEKRRHELRGMVFCRTGQFAAAVAELEAVPEAGSNRRTILGNLFLARAHQGLGNSKQAEHSLARAKELIGTQHQSQDSRVADWINRVRQDTLLQEMKQLSRTR